MYNLQIIKRMPRVLTRPKYHRILQHDQWCVYDSNKHKTVFGPGTHKSCINYINDQEKE